MPFEISSTEFDFKSARDWQQLPSQDPSRVILTCPETVTTVTLTMDAFAIPADKFEEAAAKLISVRQDAHRKNVATGDTLVMDPARSAAHASGQAWEVSYTGSVVGKNVFAFAGYITTRKVVHLYLEATLPMREGQGDVFQEIISGFQILIP